MSEETTGPSVGETYKEVKLALRKKTSLPPAGTAPNNTRTKDLTKKPDRRYMMLSPRQLYRFHLVAPEPLL